MYVHEPQQFSTVVAGLVPWTDTSTCETTFTSKIASSWKITKSTICQFYGLPLLLLLWWPTNHPWLGSKQNPFLCKVAKDRWIALGPTGVIFNHIACTRQHRLCFFALLALSSSPLDNSTRIRTNNILCNSTSSPQMALVLNVSSLRKPSAIFGTSLETSPYCNFIGRAEKMLHTQFAFNCTTSWPRFIIFIKTHDVFSNTQRLVLQ